MCLFLWIRKNHTDFEWIGSETVVKELNEYEENLKWKEIPTTSGDVIIFPGTLNHRTQINKSLEDRWVLTTNLILKNNEANLLKP